MINITTRKIGGDVIATLIRGDNATTAIRFNVPERADGVDLSGLSWAVLIRNAAGETDVYVPAKAERDGHFITFDWFPGGVATAAAGLTEVMISGTAQADDPPVWQSATYCVRVDEKVDADPAGDDAQKLTELQQLIVFVQSALPDVIDAGRAAQEAANRANEAAKRVESIAGTAVDETLTRPGAAADAAVVGGKFDKLSEEIGNQTREKPLVYIDGAIPTTKDNVLATMTVKSKWLNIFAYIKIKCQGSSSMSYPKKNFTVTLYQDAARTIPLEITIPGWKHASNKFVLKANYIDHLHARNIISAQLWSEIVASRPDYDALPEKFRNSPNNGAVDGFPTIVYTNGNYQGVYTWNIGKDAWLWGMDEDNPNHVLMCAETNTNGTYAETPCNFRALWSGVNEEYWSVEVGENSDAVKTALNDLIGFVMNATDEEFVERAESYLDVQSAIDYYLFACASCGIDNLGKNMLLGKYDARKWMLGQYDLDSTWGLWWDGSKFIPATTAFPDDYQEEFSLLFERIVKLYKKQLVDRGLELRKNALSGANIISHFERFVAEIGAEAYADDLIPYPGVPSADSNNIWQIRNFVSARLAYYDAWLSGLMDVEYDTPYPIKDGVYSHGLSSMTINSGNHVKVDIATNEVYANLSDGVFNGYYLNFAYSEPLFALKAGDVVTRKLTNITVSDDIRTNRKLLSLNMIGENGEIKFDTNVSLEKVGSETESSVTIADDVNIGYLNMWIGSGAGTVSGAIEFDLYLYVNGERYV